MAGAGDRPAGRRYVLVVEDDETLRGLLAAALQGVGAPLRLAAAGQEALLFARGAPPSVAVIDLNLPDLYGAAVAQALRALDPHLPIVLISGMPASTVAEDAWKARAAAYLIKPFDCEALAGTVSRLLAAPRPQAGNLLLASR